MDEAVAALMKQVSEMKESHPDQVRPALNAVITHVKDERICAEARKILNQLN